MVNLVSVVLAQNPLIIGVVNDKETHESEALFQQLKEDIIGVVGQAATVTFSEVLYNDFEITLARENYNFLSDNSDIIISFGVVNTVMLYQAGTYEKPTILIGSINSDIVTCPRILAQREYFTCVEIIPYTTATSITNRINPFTTSQRPEISRLSKNSDAKK